MYLSLKKKLFIDKILIYIFAGIMDRNKKFEVEYHVILM